jgi:hypothetical protein
MKILQSMGYQILSRINAISVIMPTGLVGTVLLTLRGRGVGRNEVSFQGSHFLHAPICNDTNAYRL